MNVQTYSEEPFTKCLGAYRWVIFALVAILLVVVGNALVTRRVENGPSREFTIRDTGISFKRMVEDSVTSVISPTRYRFLLPMIARIMPFDPFTSARIFCYVSLFVFYVLTLEMCARMGIPLVASFGGLFLVYSSTNHLYYYHNPYETDPFGFMILSIMLLAFLSNSFAIFAVAGLTGILQRENVILGIPLWFTKCNVRQSLILIVATVLVFLIPRLVLMPSWDQLIGQPSNAITGRVGPFLKDVFLSWRYVWFVGILGLVLIPRSEHFYICATAFLLLTLGAFFACATHSHKNDTYRMFAYVVPILTVSSAQVFATVMARQPYLAGLIGVFSVLQLVLSRPNAIWGRASWVFSSNMPRIVLLVLGSGFACGAFWLLRAEIISQLRDKSRGMWVALQNLYGGMRRLGQ